jgi:hypothetical protein
VSNFESLDYLKVLLIIAPFVSWNENCTQVLHVLLEKCASLALCKGFYKACVCCERRKQKKSQKQQERDEDKGVMKKFQFEKNTLQRCKERALEKGRSKKLVKEWVNGAEIKRDKCAKLFANKSMLVVEGGTHLNKPIKRSNFKVVIKKI